MKEDRTVVTKEKNLRYCMILGVKNNGMSQHKVVKQ
jgi:hypothetical protein